MRFSSWLDALGRKAPAFFGMVLVGGAFAAAGACGGSTGDESSTLTPGGVGGSGGSSGASGSAGSGGLATTCTPGQVVACPCAGASVMGTQTCSADGTSLGACTGCPAAMGGAGGGAGKGGASGASGAAGKAGGSGGSGGAGGSGMGAECKACVETTCKMEIDTCNADPECAAPAACVLDMCLDKLGDFKKLAACGVGTCNVPFQGPASQEIFAIGQCAQNGCATECGVSGGMGGSGGSGGSGTAGSGTAGSGTAGSGAGGDPGAAPDKIGCGPSVCDKTKGEDCCISFNSTTPSYSCKPAGMCSGGFVNIDQPCDGPEDCPGMGACCGTLANFSGKIACSMNKTCEGNPQQTAQLCHLDSDCPMGSMGAGVCQTCNVQGTTLRVCNTCPGGGLDRGPVGENLAPPAPLPIVMGRGEA